MPGPLPTKNPRRRNQPAIPTTLLPAGGFAGPYPRPPKWVELGAAGKAWWRWAWHLPQAAGWSAGDLVAIARRASIEDDLAALRQVRGLNVEDVLTLVVEDEVDTALRHLEFLARSLAALASNKITLCREARELDDRLGLTPKAMASLRWKIAAPEAAAAAPTAPTTRRLRAVDSSASA
jgi:hypothetical protein